MLLHDDVLRYMLQKGLLDASDVVDYDLTIVELSRRNQLFKIYRRDRPGLIVKQGPTPEGQVMVTREGKIYDFLHANRGGTSIVKYLVSCYGYDEANQVLLLELPLESRALDDYHVHTGRFSVQLADQMGRALAALHCGTRLDRPEKAVPELAPWVLFLHRPPLSGVSDLSGANSQLVRIIQSSAEFGDLLEKLSDRWHVESLIHGDVKFSNWVVLNHAENRGHGQPRLKLIDWELAMGGDPAWDVGSVFQDYLVTWIMSIPVFGVASPERFVPLARYPIDRFRPSIQAFWRAYQRAVGPI